MTEPLNYPKVWNALSSDPGAAHAPPAIIAALRELLEPLPEGLAEILDQPVSMATFGAAKLAVIERAVEIDLVGKIAGAMPEGSFGPMPNEMVAEMGRMMLKQMVTVFHEVAFNTKPWLDSNGLGDREALAHPQLGRFNAASLAAYDAGTLTIRGLLETQPLAVLKNEQ